jgi:hypothetical protein
MKGKSVGFEVRWLSLLLCAHSQGRALNRRVDVKVIVNKGLNEGI